MDGESRAGAYLEEVGDLNADKRGRIIPRAMLRALVLDLTTARAAVEFACRGDFLFLDRNSTGVISVQLNNSSESSMPMAAFDNVEGVPIDRVIITHAAQPGLVANLWYGYHARFRANSNTLTSIASTVNVLDQGGNYAASFQSNTALGANTNENAVAPASNLNGCRIWNAHGTFGGGTAVLSALLAKASAPATQIDGDLLQSSSSITNSRSSPSIALPMRLLVSSGKGIYRRTDATAETSALWGMQYTLP